jgi:hypothetical protein
MDWWWLRTAVGFSSGRKRLVGCPEDVYGWMNLLDDLLKRKDLQARIRVCTSIDASSSTHI